jgi:hypothetical protein
MVQEKGPITRREFYTAVGLLYNMLGIVALQTSRSGDESIRSVLALVIALAAIGTGLLYIVMALREKAQPSA